MYAKTCWTPVKLAAYKPLMCNATHQPKQGHTRNQFDAKMSSTRNLVYSFKEEHLRL